MQYIRESTKYFIYVYNNLAQNNSQDSRASMSMHFKNTLGIFGSSSPNLNMLTRHPTTQSGCDKLVGDTELNVPHRILMSY